MLILIVPSCSNDSQQLADLIKQNGNDDDNDPLLDTDNDGVIDTQEEEDGTDPEDPDTDNDGLEDGEEKRMSTNPLNPDTDNDELSDGYENEIGTNPTAKDSDDDGIDDGEEINLDTNPILADTDGDGVLDGTEIEDNTDPLDFCSFLLENQSVDTSASWKTQDCDDDGINNGTEIENGTNPLVAEEDPVAPIIGNWILVNAYIENGTATTVVQGVTLNIEYTSTSSNENVTVTFTENPNEVTSTGTYTANIEFTVLGTQYTDEITSETPLTGGSWTIDDSFLSISTDNPETDGEYEIIEYTNSSLVLKSTINRNVYAGGADLDTTGDLILTFSKE